MEIINNYPKKFLIVFLFANVLIFLNAKSICNHSKSSIFVSLYSLKYQLPLEQSENGMPVFLGRLNAIIHVKQSVNVLCINENLVKDIFNVKLYRKISKNIEETYNDINEIYLKRSSISEKNMLIYELQKPLISGIYHLKFEKFWGYINLEEKKSIYTQKSMFNHFFGTKIYMSDKFSIPFPTIFSSSTRHSFELDIIHPQNTTTISNTEQVFEDAISVGNIWKRTKFSKTNSIPFSNFGFFILPSEYKKIFYNESLPSVSFYYNWINKTEVESNRKLINKAKTIKMLDLFKMVNFRFSDEILIKNLNIVGDDNFLINSDDSLNNVNIYSGIIINNLKNDPELLIKIILKQFTVNILKFESSNYLQENIQEEQFIENNINNIILDDIFQKMGENVYEEFKIKKYLEMSLKDQLNFFSNYTSHGIENISSYEKTNIVMKLLSISNTLLSIKKIIGENIFNERLKQFVEIYKFHDVEEEEFWSMIMKGFYNSNICICDILKIVKYSKTDLILRVETDKESLFSFNFINTNVDKNNKTIPLFIELSSINGINGTRKQLKLPLQLLTEKVVNIKQLKRMNKETLFLSNVDYIYNYRTFYDHYLWGEIFDFMETYPFVLKISEKTYLIETFCYQLSYDGIENYKNIFNDFKKQLFNLPVQPINCILPA